MILPVIKRSKRLNFILKVLILFTVLAITGLVYLTGGTKTEFDHMFYLPIFYTGIIFNVRWATFVAIISGFLVGPFMPFDVATNEQQELLDWLTRLSMYVVVGLVAGVVKGFFVRILTDKQISYTHFTTTNIPNSNLLDVIDYDKFDNPNGVTVVTIAISKYERLLFYFGQENYNKLLEEIYDELNLKITYNKVLLSNNSNLFWLIINNDDTVFIRNEIRKIIKDLRQKIKNPIYFEFATGVEHITNLKSREKNTSLFTASTQRAFEIIARHSFLTDSADSSFYDYSLLKDINKALSNNEFFLMFQPIIPNKEDGAFYFEALVRWNHPLKGIIPPNKFIPIVENTLLINLLTLWVLENTIKEIIKYKERGIKLVCSINISPRNLYSTSFLDNVRKVIDDYNFDPKQIKFEITEGLAINISDISLNNLNGLNQLGIDLIIDDFGSGHSSISYLIKLPIKIVKLDRLFTKDVLSNYEHFVLFKSITNLLKELNIQVVAEGIETKKQYDLFKAENLDYYQGYYFSKPLEMKEIAKYIKSSKKVATKV